ncbi:hypothetical protein JCM3774_003454, partial [Rhodotorula dairenensis]
ASVTDGEAFVNFMKSDTSRKRAKATKQLRTLEIWYDGVEKFVNIGGWAGESARLFAYVGESDGWDRLDKKGDVPIRPLQHLVGLGREKNMSFHQFLLQSYLRFSLTNPDVDVKLFITFISSADHLRGDLPLCQVKLVEALLSELRLSSVTLGGANISPCGRTSQLADIQNALSPLPPLVPLSAMCVQQLLPKSLACILKRKFEDD